MAGGIEAIAASISADLVRRLPRQNKKQREGLALLAATMLDVRSANLMDLAASLPRNAERIDMRYQYISRVLGNEHIETDAIMRPFAYEVLERLAKAGRRIVVIIDQTQANDTQQAVVVAVRVGGRSLPIAWRVKETEGAIGFPEQRAALDVVRKWMPDGANVVLMGDRFYGSPDLITWCRSAGWDWRLRLKADLLVFENGGESTLAQCFLDEKRRMLKDVELTGKRVRTNVGMVHEAGHPEPWFIAMSDTPTTARTFDYGLRWGIEAMFSDFKSRGFGLEDSQLQRTDRMDRLILVMTLALYWAVSTGMWASENAALPVEKKRPTRLRKRWLAA